MSAEKLANRYADAFFEEANSNQILEKANQDFAIVANAISSSKEFNNFIKNPIIDTNKN
jgi:F0F1-type ATP synthase delta subunit